MRRIVALALASSVAFLAVACAAPGEADPAEEVGQTDQALANTSGDPLLGSVCRACGCSWVARTGSDGCTKYRCECDSTDKANCVIKAPGGSAVLTTSTTPTTTVKGSFSTGTLYFSP